MKPYPFLPNELWYEIRPVFLRAWPKEAIVAIWPDGWHELENVHPNPCYSFRIGEQDRVELLARPPLVLLHSHPNGSAEPSDTDTLNQLAQAVPWGVVAVDGEPVTMAVYGAHYPNCWGAGLPIPPLIGRTYLWGVRDCLTLCQDFYTLNGIHMPRVPRARDPNVYAKGTWGYDQFASEPKRLGLRPIAREARQPGDMLRWALRANRHNHCAIYLGEGRFLHQQPQKTSGVHIAADEDRFIELTNAEFFRPKSVRKPLITCLDKLEQVTPRPLSA